MHRCLPGAQPYAGLQLALRQAREGLRSWLVTLPWVEQVTDAEPAEGGAGCSVVWCR